MPMYMNCPSVLGRTWLHVCVCVCVFAVHAAVLVFVPRAME